ncbi:alpha/beta fold hydrolase [Nocardia panacis]|uniref:alpha/beta fold hydrolase n=1 Tax=Nocardia panacis TaxID=2340916 RepID=UPI001939CF91|nr:alpha/beta hydrolase [Nocardia panacis]
MTRQFETGSIRSSDGTTIGYRRVGQGPALILVHGAMMTSQQFERLAAALADEFTVFAPDRRGRGMSGPVGANYGIETEIGDLTALVRETNAHNVFGLSSGAVIAMAAALALPQIRKLALYEPPLTGDHFSPLGWTARYERELAENRLAAAFVSALKGTGDKRSVASLPRALLVPAMTLALRLDKGEEGRPAVRKLVPTVRCDITVLRSTTDIWDRLAELRCDTLLLGGDRSIAYLPAALDQLQATLPAATRVTFPDAGHTATFNDEKPELVAAELRRFLTRR